MKKIAKLVCFCDTPHEARFMVSIGESGCIMIDKDGCIHPDEGFDHDLKTQADVIRAIKDCGIEEVEVLGYCPEYLDESSIKVVFEDGKEYAEYGTEKEAFIRAFAGVLFNI